MSGVPSANTSRAPSASLIAVSLFHDRPRLDVRAHDAGNAVAVGDPDAGQAKTVRLPDQFLGIGGAAQEREVGGDGKLGIRGHRLA